MNKNAAGMDKAHGENAIVDHREGVTKDIDGGR